MDWRIRHRLMLPHGIPERGKRLGDRRTGLAHWSVEPGSGSRPQRIVADDPAAPGKALLKEEIA